MYFDKEKINRIETKYNNCEKISRVESLYYQNIKGTRKSGLGYVMNHNELDEYVKCKVDIFYFIEKYLNIKLYDYQEAIIKDYINHRFTINMASRQTGINRIYAIVFLHYITFNCDSNVMVIHNKGCNAVEQLNNVKKYYKELPFFLKGGVTTYNQKYLSFDNGSSITITTNIKYEKDYHIIMINDFAQMDNNFYEEYCNIVSTIMSYNDSKLIIKSTPNGYNHFMKMVQDAERNDGDPKKNNYKVRRIYWWDVPGRDDNWKEEEIAKVGLKFFQQEYELCFHSTKGLKLWC